MKLTNVFPITDTMDTPKHVLTIVLGCGNQVSLGEYARGVAAAKARPKVTFTRGLTGGWPATGREIASQFRAGIHDRINRRGGLKDAYRQENPTRLLRRAAARVACECRWCGSLLPSYQPQASRFCDADCRHSYSS